MSEKDAAIVEGGPLMDPSSKQFQEMLTKSQEAAVAKLAVKPDTSMVEDGKDVKEKPASSAESTEEEEPKDDDTKDESDEDEPGDDIGNLKHKVSGLQAELTRIRKQKSDSSAEATSLKERIADMEGQLKVLRENKTTSTIEEKLAKLSDDQVRENRIAWDDELSDARVAARLAAKDGDDQGVREANERITNARKMLNVYDTEKDRRVEVKATQKHSQDDETTVLTKEMDDLFTSVSEAVPDINVKDSAIWKAGKAEYDRLPTLMKRLGALGELVAVATAMAKNPALIGKKTTEKLVADIEKAADKAFQKGGTAPSSGTAPKPTTINSRDDLNAFEEQVRKVKGG